MCVYVNMLMCTLYIHRITHVYFTILNVELLN